MNRQFFRRALFPSALGMVAAALIFSDTVSNRLQSALADSEEEPVPVCVVEKIRTVVTIPAFGEVAGANSVPVEVPQTRSGPLTIAWLIPEGSIVKEGEPIVRFDKTDVELTIENQRNVLASVNERLEISRKAEETSEREVQIDTTSAGLDYQFAKNLLPEDETIFSKWDIMEAEMDTRLAEERLDFLEQKQQLQAQITGSDIRILMIEKKRAEEEMDIALKTLESLELVSPVSGLVIYRVRRNSKPQIGDQCWPRQVLVEVMELDKLQARLYVLERDGGGIEAEMEVDLQLDAFPSRIFKGVIKSVSPLAQSLERNSPLLYFTCDAGIAMGPEDLENIRPGMLVQAEIIRQEYDSCLVVPESAVTTKDEEDLVYVQQNGMFVPRRVGVDPGPQGQSIILDGVEEGEVIALRNPFETRRLSLPDFSKASRPDDRNRRPSRRMTRSRRSR